MGTDTAGADVQLPEPPLPLVDATPQLLDLLVTDLDAGFAALVRAHQRTVYSVVLRACANPSDAEDLTAQTFLRAYTALLGYDGDRIRALRLRPWLVTIALNAWRNAVRDNSRRPVQVPLCHSDELPASVDDTARIAERLTDRRVLAGLVAELPEAQRIAVVLRYVCDIPQEEIAQVLHCPVGTVKSHVSRALHRLRAGYALLGDADATHEATEEIAR